jgi:hypothetical protein
LIRRWILRWLNVPQIPAVGALLAEERVRTEQSLRMDRLGSDEQIHHLREQIWVLQKTVNLIALRLALSDTKKLKEVQ